MAADLFAKAKASAPVSTKKAPKREEMTEIAIVGIEPYAAVCAAETAVKALKTAERGPLDKLLLDIHVEQGMRLKACPDSFKAIDGKAEATITFPRKGSNVALTDEECALLDEHKIPYEVADEVEETFIIKKEYIEDAALMKKVSAALAKVPGLPEDFIQFQSVKKRVVVKETLHAIFQLKTKETVKALIGIVSTIGVKPKLNTDEQSALAIVEQLVSKRKQASTAACD